MMQLNRSLGAGLQPVCLLRGRGFKHLAACPTRQFTRKSTPAAPRRTVVPVKALVSIPALSWTATGVPLFDYFMALSVKEAATKACTFLAISAVGVLLGQKLLDFIEDKLVYAAEHITTATGLDLLVTTGLVASHRPARVVLPLYGLSYGTLVLMTLVEVTMIKLGASAPVSLRTAGHWAVALLKALTQIMQDSSELLMILFVSWFLVSWKNKFLLAITGRLENRQDDSEDTDRWSRVLVPLSGVMSWAIIGMAVLLSLTCLGFDVRPLLALGSVSSLVVGLAAQSTLSNFVSAMALFTTRPFITGDRIQLKSLSGSVIVAGVVERIMPMRTVIRTDQKVPVYINNKDVASLMIVNESQQRRMSVQSGLGMLDADLVLRYPEDVDKVASIELAVTEYLNQCEEVERGTAKCTLSGFNERGPVLHLKAFIKASLANKASVVRAKLLRESEKIVREKGAMLFVLPPTCTTNLSGSFS